MSKKSKSRKAQENGAKAEREAEDYLRKLYLVVERVNELVDFVVHHNMPVEVKSCQARIHRSGTRSGKKYGRFTLRKDQHEYLIKTDGMYLFVVQYKCGATRILLLPAKTLPYQRQYSWYRVFHGGFLRAVSSK